ncbi:hypothetical protein PsYK624_169070 [Phanerochaete sordida]|uniref:Uncharacterized protein n=1 Tax=Phanerochaete sordida TaxID=48140 RepID=A0A9P3GSC7_9APHY|nr:hypothetical protein PsYK624_169070 [Phanerochaete sordida]
MTIFGIGVTEIILLLRTWAIWNRDRRIGYTLAGSIICMYAAGSFFLAKFLAGSRAQLARTLSPSVDGCFLVTKNDLLLVEYVLIIAFETAVLALTLAKLARVMITPGYMMRSTPSSLAELLYRDGIWFYVCLFGISLINVIVVAAAPRDFATLLACVQRALHSMLASRLLLNLRKASMHSAQSGQRPALGEDVSADNAGLYDTENSNITRTLFSIDDGMWMDGGGPLGTLSEPPLDPEAELRDVEEP